MSANRKLTSISAPPRCFTMNEKQDWQSAGLLSAGRLPIARMSGAAGPANGAAHIWQRGPWGSTRKTRRARRSRTSPRVRYVRQNSSTAGSVGGTPIS